MPLSMGLLEAVRRLYYTMHTQCSGLLGTVPAQHTAENTHTSFKGTFMLSQHFRDSRANTTNSLDSWGSNKKRANRVKYAHSNFMNIFTSII